MRERSRGCVSLAHSTHCEGFHFGHSNRREGFPDGSVVKNPPANAGDVSSISWVGKSSEEGNGNPLQYSCLGNPVDRGAWQAIVHGVTKSYTQLSD